MDLDAREEVERLTAYVTELEGAIAQLKLDLIHDKLTGLKTRAFFEEEARLYFDIAMHSHGSTRKEWFGFRRVSFIFFDLDHFKQVNDNFCHDAGDEVLKATARTIRDHVREGDTAARWGGEEIAVTLVGATERDAVHKAEEIREAVEKLSFDKYPGLKVTISGGVASAEHDVTFDEVLQRADRALYNAKESGRNKIVAYSSLN